MNDVEIFRPLYEALNAFIAEQRKEAKFEIGFRGKARLDGTQIQANKTLIKLVPYQRNLNKLFTAARVGHESKARLAGHQLVAYLVKDWVMKGFSEYFTGHPIWALPVTPELVQLVLPMANPKAELYKEVFKTDPYWFRLAQLDVLAQATGNNLLELHQSYEKLCVSARKKAERRREKIIEKVKTILTQEELDILLGKQR